MSGPGLIGGGAAQGYGYPMANGLLAAMSAPQPGATNWTNVALNLAGNPHAGPYAASDGALPSGFSATSAPVGTSGSSSPSGGTQILGSVIGALSKDPSLLQNGVSTLENLFGGSVPTGMAGTAPGGAGLASGLTAAQQADLSSAFTGAPVAGSVADSMGLTAGSLSPLAASALAPVGTGAITAAGNAAGASAASELSGALASTPAAAAPAAAAPAASSAGAAGSTAAGALAADAGALGVLGWMGYGATHGPSNNGWSLGAMHGLIDSTKQATDSGLITPADGITGAAGAVNAFNPNGSINQGLVSAVQNLQQLQLGDFGPATQSYVAPALAAMGYQNIQQAAAGKQLAGGTPASSGGTASRLRRRF